MFVQSAAVAAWTWVEVTGGEARRHPRIKLKGKGICLRRGISGDSFSNVPWADIPGSSALLLGPAALGMLMGTGGRVSMESGNKRRVSATVPIVPTESACRQIGKPKAHFRQIMDKPRFFRWATLGQQRSLLQA
jgi:hypothetical protein